MRDPVAVIDEVTVELAGRRVLGPLSLEVGAGEHWAVLGPNGAGKTTLFSLLGAERHPTTGNVTVLGERIGRSDVRVLRRRIGVVGHLISDRLPPYSSALEIVLTGKGSLLSPWWGSFSPADEHAASQLLEEMGCGPLAGQAWAACSQGERQRVLIARALFARAELLLLDEPAVGVDLPGREALIGVLDDLAENPQGPTTVQIAHTLEELPGSITHALLLRDGVAVACGAAEEVLTSELLSTCFAMPISVGRIARRYSATAQPR